MAMDKPKTPGYIVPVARRLRTGQTSAEQVLWTCLRNRRLGGAKFRRQHPIGRYIADFYCHEALLAVELEGNVHDEANQADYDAVRQQTIESLGITVLRFSKVMPVSGPCSGD